MLRKYAKKESEFSEGAEAAHLQEDRSVPLLDPIQELTFMHNPVPATIKVTWIQHMGSIILTIVTIIMMMMYLALLLHQS